MSAAPLAGRQRPASLAPIYAALAILVALGLLGLGLAFWPSGAPHPSSLRAPRFQAPGEHPAGNGAGVPSLPATPRRRGVWTLAGSARGFGYLW